VRLDHAFTAFSGDVDNTTNETLISVSGADGARDVEFIVVFGVANGKLVRINPYNRSYIVGE